MRIALTGSNGRVGRAVSAAAVAAGHTVVAIDRKPDNDDADVDVTSYADLEHAVDGCDAIIHLAAYASPHGQPDHEVHNNNVTGSYNVLSAAARLGIRRVCLASSINAVGGAYSRRPRYDYFPVDEDHPTYNEDAYSLSKWIGEAQADSFARRYEDMAISSLRFHAVTPDRDTARAGSTARSAIAAKHLWGYTTFDAAARACLLSLTADFSGHECFYVVAPTTAVDTPSRELCGTYYPEVPIRGDLSGTTGLFDCGKAERLLGWTHDQPATTGPPQPVFPAAD